VLSERRSTFARASLGIELMLAPPWITPKLKDDRGRLAAFSGPVPLEVTSDVGPQAEACATPLVDTLVTTGTWSANIVTARLSA